MQHLCEVLKTCFLSVLKHSYTHGNIGQRESALASCCWENFPKIVLLAHASIVGTALACIREHCVEICFCTSTHVLDYPPGRVLLIAFIKYCICLCTANVFKLSYTAFVWIISITICAALCNVPEGAMTHTNFFTYIHLYWRFHLFQGSLIEVALHKWVESRIKCWVIKSVSVCWVN